MKRLTPEEIQLGFKLLGLTTEEERAKFSQFRPQPQEEPQEFTRFDIVSQLPEASHAELA